ncbi:MAG TPA: patatin-like phospholipase family protein [Thermoanaerobaculia bacterium]|nr:patatin-like phospholipase family protein [Thermoanaerobaculia bacterium]
MASPPSSLVRAPGNGPVALVLSGGGARAAYQVGLLRYLRRAFPDFRFQIITGTSAGAINAAYVAAHPGTMAEAAGGLAEVWATLTFDNVFRVDASALAKSVVRWGTRLLSGGAHLVARAKGLLDTAPLRTLLSSVMATVSGELVGIGDNVENGRLSALALTTINWATGQTVTWIEGRDFATSESPQRRTAKARIGIDHVMASAALPLLFPAVRIGSSWYGDGGVRLLAPLAPAIHLGAQRILAVSTRYRRTQSEADQPVTRGYPPPAQVIGTVLNAVFLDQVEQDAQALKRINRLLAKLPPEQRDALRPIDLHILQPSEDLGKLAADYQDALPKGLGFMTRGLGSHETRSADLLSLLLFHPDYLEKLMAIGERDAETAHDRLAEVLGFAPAPEAAQTR